MRRRRRHRRPHRCHCRPLGRVEAKRVVPFEGLLAERCYCGRVRMTSDASFKRYERDRLPKRGWARPVVAHTGLIGCLLIVLSLLRTGSIRRLRHSDPERWPDTLGNLPPIRGGSAITASATGGNWSAGAAWVGGTPPGAGDDAILASTSGSITVTAGAACRSLDCTGSGNYAATLGFGTGSLAIGTTTTNGSLAMRFSTTMTVTNTSGTVSFVSTSATQVQITTAGKTIPGPTFQGGASGSFLLMDSFTTGSGGTTTFTSGILNTNSQTLTLGLLSSSNSNARTLTLGASSITLAGTGTVLNFATSTNLTVTANTATMTCSTASATPNLGSANFNGMTLALTGSGNATIAGTAPTLGSFTRTGTAVATDVFILSATSLTCTSTFRVNSASGVQRVLVQTSAAGTQRTITAASFAASNTVDFQDINGAGTATWTAAASGATFLGDCGGNAGITFTTSATQTFVGSPTGAPGWSTASNWTSRVPLPQDDVVIATLTTGAITPNMPRAGRSIDFTGSTGTITMQSTAVFGNLTFGAGMTISASSASWTMAGRSTYTITTNGVNLNNSNLLIIAPGGSYSLGSDIAISNAAKFISQTMGNFDFNGHNATIPAFTTSTAATRTLSLGSGTITLTGTGTVWTITGAAGLTLNQGTSTIVIADTSSTAKTFSSAPPSGALVYNNISVTGGGTGAVTLAGSATFNTLTIGAPKVINFTASQTWTLSTLNATGTAGNTITMQSTTPGTQWMMSVGSGTVSCDYLVLQDSKAQGGAGFYAGTHSTNVSNNTGWSFTAPFTTASDSFSFSDSASATISRLVSATDSYAVSDGAATSTVLSRVAADSFAVSDTATRLRSGTRTAVDSFTLSDTAARLSSLVRVAGDSFVIADSAARTAGVLRSAADGWTVTDTAADRSATGRSASDSFAVADTVAQIGSLLRAPTDSFGISDSAATRLILVRVAADSFAIVDAASRTTLGVVTAADSWSVSDHAVAHGKIPLYAGLTDLRVEAQRTSIVVPKLVLDLTVLNQRTGLDVVKALSDLEIDDIL